MRRFLALCAVLTAVLLGVPNASEANAEFQFGYRSVDATSVELGIRCAAGRTFVVHDTQMAVVAWGTVPTNDFIVPITKTAPGGLNVRIDEYWTYVDAERDAWWL